MDIRETLEEAVDDMEMDITEIDAFNAKPEEPKDEEVPAVEEVVEDKKEEGQVDPLPEQVSDNESTVKVDEERVKDEPVQQVQAIHPPSSWRSDEKEIFAKLPPDLQQTVARRERERDGYLHQSRQKYAEIEKAVEPYEGELNRTGVSVGKMVSQALAWDKYLKEKPYDAIAELAASCKVDLRQFAKLAETATPKDPHVNQLMQETATLKSKLEEIEQEKAQARQQAEQSHFLSLSQEVEAFQNAVDSTGRAMFPYANDLREDMAYLVPRVQQEMPTAPTRQVLEEVYARAMRANPRTFAEYEKQIKQTQQEANQQRVKRAKIAGSSVAGSPNGSKVASDTSIRGLLEAGLAGTL